MNITINVIESCTDISDCMRAEEIRFATTDDKHLNMLSEYVLHGWPSVRAEVQKDLQMCWSFRNKTAIVHRFTMKGKMITLNQLHMNHMGKEETRLLACKSICWINMNADTQNTVKNCPTSLDFLATQPKAKTISHNIPGRPSVGADTFIINNKHYLCIVVYYCKYK